MSVARRGAAPPAFASFQNLGDLCEIRTFPSKAHLTTHETLDLPLVSFGDLCRGAGTSQSRARRAGRILNASQRAAAHDLARWQNRAVVGEHAELRALDRHFAIRARQERELAGA